MARILFLPVRLEHSVTWPWAGTAHIRAEGGVWMVGPMRIELADGMGDFMRELGHEEALASDRIKHRIQGMQSPRLPAADPPTPGALARRSCPATVACTGQA